MAILPSGYNSPVTAVHTLRLLTQKHSDCRQALSVYKGRSWQFIEEHIHDTLGRTFREMRNLQAAVHHFMAILPCPQAATALQGRYLQQFLDAVHQASAAQVCGRHLLCL